MSIIITARGGSGGGSPANVNVPNETDWTSYTPTFQGLGTVTGIETEWRQVGDSYEIRGKLVTGTVTASTIQIGLPNSATSANSSKIPSITMSGILTRDASAASGTIFPILIQPSVTYVTVGGNFAGGAVTGMSTLTSQTGSALFNNGETEAFFCTVPIAGLSANTTYSINSTTSFEFFASSQVTTNSGTISSGTFTTFDNSPALTFTPANSGKYKVYSSIPLQPLAPGSTGGANARIINTSGGATLLYESQAGMFNVTANQISSVYTESVYTLVGGTPYVFDIQAAITTATSVENDGGVIPFYMFAERCG